ADRYLVATRTPSRETPLRMLRDAGDAHEHRVREFRSINAFAATLTESEAAELRKSPEVRSVTPVVPRRISGMSAPAYAAATATARQRMPYGIQMIHAPEMWTVTRGSGPINVAVLDTGITIDHPDLAPNYAGGYNVFTQSNDPIDGHGHGTHVSGTIAAAD